jgi:hypothetical protein
MATLHAPSLESFQREVQDGFLAVVRLVSRQRTPSFGRKERPCFGSAEFGGKNKRCLRVEVAATWMVGDTGIEPVASSV